MPEDLRLRWSPLFETEPEGGPDQQPKYLNAVLVVDGKKICAIEPSEKAGLELLNKLLALEKEFGRDRQSSLIRWGPRSLDLDILAWGAFHLQHKQLTLPHPRLIERKFVVVPLAAALTTTGVVPKRIAPQLDWPE